MKNKNSHNFFSYLCRRIFLPDMDMEGKILERAHTVACFETDFNKIIRPEAFMDWAQELAQLHAEKLHFGYDDFISRDLAWVVTRFYARFINPPKWKDAVTLQTWHKGLERIMSIRDFRILDKDGNMAVAATSSWVIVNTRTRQFTREHFAIDKDESVCKENAVERSAEKVSMPRDEEPELAAEHIVSYSDIDMNGHTNNASYMRWAMDAVDREVSLNRCVSDFTINFNHESKAGECVSIYRVRKDNDFYIEGRIEDRTVFTTLIRFK